MIRVVTSNRPPLVFVEGQANNRTIFTGYLVDLLPVLLQASGIKEPYTIYNFEGSGGALLHNGSWSGIMGQLTTGAADLALFPLTLTSQRATAIQHTSAYMDDGYGILVHIKEVDPGYSFLMPFSGKTWLCFLAALVAVVVMLTILDSMTRRARLRAIETTYGAHHVQERRRRDKLMGHAIETIMMSVGSGAAPTSRSWSVKIMFIAWAIFCVIMLSAYTANLTAHLTVNQIGVPIRSLADLADAPQQFGVPADSSVSAYFKNSSDQGARSLRHKMVEYQTTAEGAAAVRGGSIAAFVCDYPVAQYFTQEPPCVLALGSETIGSGSLVLGVAPNSSLLEPLNMGLLQLSEAGYLAELRRKWFVEASQCNAQQDDSSEASGNGRLSMTQAWSVFIILGAGMALSAIAAGLEVLYYKKLFRGVNSLREDVSRMGTRASLRKKFSRSKSVRFREADLAGIVIPPAEDDASSCTCSDKHCRHHKRPPSPEGCCSSAAAATGYAPSSQSRQRMNGDVHKPPPAAGAAAGAETHERSALGRLPPGCKDPSVVGVCGVSELQLLPRGPFTPTPSEHCHHNTGRPDRVTGSSPGVPSSHQPGLGRQQHQQHRSPFQDVQAMPVSLIARATGAAAAAASSLRATIDQHMAPSRISSRAELDSQLSLGTTHASCETSEDDCY